MTVSAQTQEQVAAVLDAIARALAAGDRGALASLVDPGLSGFWFGRPVRGPSDLADAVAGPFALDGLEISCEGTVAWARADLASGGTGGGFTAVLRGTGHAWLVAQVHASLPV